MKKITTVVLFYLLVLGRLYAQDAVPSIGGEAKGIGGLVSYSVGQLVYNTNIGTNFSIAQGVQHPYEIFISVGIELKEINLELSVYPNPTFNNLMLEISNYNDENLTYYLYDMQGKLLKSIVVVSTTTIIEMERLTAATYFLKVTANNDLIKTFRIIKN